MPEKVDRQETDKRSVLNLAEMLREAASSPIENIDAELLQRLKSQGALASYSNSAKGVVRMSLNHQKAVAMRSLGGYGALDRLRKLALRATQAKTSGVKKRTHRGKESIETELRALKLERQALLHDLFLIQRAYDLRCQQARRYAAAVGGNTIELCQKEQSELDAGLALRQVNGVRSNVVQLRPRKIRD